MVLAILGWTLPVHGAVLSPGGAWPHGRLAGASSAAPERHASSTLAGDYPYAGAVCEFGAAGGPHCANPRNRGDQYDWGYAGAPGRPFRQGDQWGYEYRNCTSYVAWRLARDGVPVSLFRDLGNASRWLASVAGEPGVVVNGVASPGAVAVWAPSSGVGHVAWVDSARRTAAGVTVTVSDYNYFGTGAFATHVVTSPPSGYIHFPGGRPPG
jgi:surface antigen